MNAKETLSNIIENNNLISYPFRYCLVSDTKMPYTIYNKLARPNVVEDFCALPELLSFDGLANYKGIGVSIQASNIFAIDVDGCFKTPFDATSADDRAKEIINIFKDEAYIEFSFSGKGMRILFNSDVIEDYQNIYYIKNDKNHCEFYQPSKSFRYVTLTGKSICNNPIKQVQKATLNSFLDGFMKRPYNLSANLEKCDIEDERGLDLLIRMAKCLTNKDFYFQNIWYDTNHDTDFFTSSSQESQKDFALLKYLYDNITQDKSKLKSIFEASPYFKSKDKKHIDKWNHNDFRYYNYIYAHL